MNAQREFYYFRLALSNIQTGIREADDAADKENAWIGDGNQLFAFSTCTAVALKDASIFFPASRDICSSECFVT
jgi:hypothetical protein